MTNNSIKMAVHAEVKPCAPKFRYWIAMRLCCLASWIASSKLEITVVEERSK